MCGNHNKKTNCQTVWDVPLEVFFPFGAAAEPLEQPGALLPQGMCRAVGAYVQIVGSRSNAKIIRKNVPKGLFCVKERHLCCTGLLARHPALLRPCSYP